MNSTDPPSPEPGAEPAASPARAPGKPKTFNCPSCGGAVTLRAVGITINAVCGSCGSVIDVANENYQVIDRVNKKIRHPPLPMGARGRLQGQEWEVVGYSEKTDGSGQYGWREYLLYNPYYGFRFLVESSGHWSLVKGVRQDVPGAGVSDPVWQDGRRFALFLRGEAVVAFVQGEFYWRVKTGERTAVADYIAPPYMLSVERNSEEINVSLGEYLRADEIAAAFKVEPSALPAVSGVAPNQPPPYQGTYRTLWRIGALAAVAALAVQIMTSALADDEWVLNYQLSVDPRQKDQTFSSPVFTLPKDGNVLIRSSSRVQNDWLELALTLVNEKTSQQFAVSQAIEYYYGNDGGESWSEGGQNAETFLSRVPAGDYRLLVDPDGGAFQTNRSADITLNIRRDVPNWSNFLISLPLLLIYPLFAFVRRWRFESRRWSESELVPATGKPNSSDSDEDE